MYELRKEAVLFPKLPPCAPRSANLPAVESTVREVHIPKEGKAGATRPLGFSNFEDKIVQRLFQQALTAIYEPRFLDCSYGFRTERSCHDAIKALRDHLYWSSVHLYLL